MALMILWYSGIIIGLLSGLVGIGGGTILLPLLVNFGYSPAQGVATSSLAIVLTALSSCWRNWKNDGFDIERISFLATPAIATAPIGVFLSTKIPASLLLLAFGIFLIVNIFLASLKRNLKHQVEDLYSEKRNVYLSRILTGGISGFLAGLFGIGGGAIMVPLQMLLLKENIKIAIQTSIGVILITSISNFLIYVQEGNVSFSAGLILGFGGLCGAQVSSYYLPRVPEKTVGLIFTTVLVILAANMFWQAGFTYGSSIVHSNMGCAGLNRLGG
ncbi:MAG: sulfite exporter TauE/SafE family protein [Waterburya sp.]